ncbi:type VI secretion system-associated protein TagO [Thalassospira sp. TSL5-1]|uniref:type VI secretion system-associated protein TagO n=1 Tax=Thalassospira sp. TSL5-1 TaxID=1544451 RepID=UPI00093DB63D|nr:type VI secretion system-associated protein TagO [Thalassospira sp. TSL5-1]OKH86429.1 hypothetical protein LF95_22740 [Thalassospira sp. TSL5-1]
MMATMLACGASVNAHAQTVIDDDGLAACFATANRLDRLGCYDSLLGRPNTGDEGIAIAKPAADEDEKTPLAISYVNGFLRSSNITPEGVAVTLLDHKTGAKITGTNGDLLDRINPPRDMADFDQLRRKADLYLALPALADAGEKGAMLVSCENNITRMRLMWINDFAGRTVDARFLYGNSLAQENAIGTLLRVNGQGHILETPRGLESIRLLKTITNGSRIQVSVDAGNEQRSLFFDADALRSALPMMGRHCAWKMDSR